MRYNLSVFLVGIQVSFKKQASDLTQMQCGDYQLG